MIREPSHYRAHRGRSEPTFLWVFVGGGVAFVSRGSQHCLFVSSPILEEELLWFGISF